jgi:hypothetical protein
MPANSNPINVKSTSSKVLSNDFYANNTIQKSTVNKNVIKIIGKETLHPEEIAVMWLCGR